MKTLEEGDVFERGYRPWIIENLPGYEATWRRFVGNDGASHPKPEITIPLELVSEWRRFYQSHYSMAVFAFLLNQHAEAALKYLKEIEDDGKTKTPEALVKNVEIFSQYVGLVGQICDMVKQIGGALKNREIVDWVSDFEAQRNNSIHSACIPMSDEGRGIRIPTIALQRGAEGEWSEGQKWDFIARDKLQYLDKWYRETRDELLGTLKKPLGEMIFNAAEKRFNREPPANLGRIKIPPPPLPTTPYRDPSDRGWGNVQGSGEAAIRKPSRFPESSME